MPPCGDVQQDVCSDVAGILMSWLAAHPDFVVGTNEAGMMLGGDVRAADAAVWRRSEIGTRTGGLRRAAPLLAVEVAGRDEGRTQLRDKAEWYLGAGAKVVWLVFPEEREVVVVTEQSEERFGREQRIPAHAALPELAPEVQAFFRQIESDAPSTRRQ
jgi:Uma2 family endonuclease